MAIEGLAIVLPFVAEKIPISLEPVRISDQAIPVVMADLVPKMPEERPIFLLHRMASALPLDVIGFSHIDRDQAVVMTRQNGL